MELWLPAVTVIGIYTLAVMSPGPNFLVITRNALAYSRRAGLQTALAGPPFVPFVVRCAASISSRALTGPASARVRQPPHVPNRL